MMACSLLVLSPLRNPLLLIPFFLGASSIATLLLYFFGLLEMQLGTTIVLIPAVAILIVLTLWARGTHHAELYNRILAGIWAGSLATLAYDLVRLPIAWAGVPVFKAISYFGTITLGQSSPTVASEIAGWSYHLSNGIGFGLMYAAVVFRPRWWTAVLWSLVLELAMLVTPYAEVFGYKVAPQFLAITIGSHVVYGVILWGALQNWIGAGDFTSIPKRPLYRLSLASLLVIIGIGSVAADFHMRHGATMPPSPPSQLGPHLYTTWNVLEPDRLAAMWILQRFVDRKARFHFIPPFSQISYGTAFDTPEAKIRRSGARSATEILLGQSDLEGDDQLVELAHMTHLYEIARWMLPANRRVWQLGQELLAASGECPSSDISPCVQRAFHHLDRWYGQ